MTERSSKGNGSAPDFTLGEWLVQPSLNRITRGEAGVRLRPQLMDLLVCLAARPGQTVTREEIFASVWPGQFVAESGLARCVAELRQALGDAAGQDSRYIETIPKRGYRLIAPIASPPPTAAGSDEPPAPPSTPPPSVPTAVAGPPSSDSVSHPPDAPPPGTAQDHPSAPVAPAPASRRSAGRRLRLVAASVAALVVIAGAWRLFGGRPRTTDRDTLVIAFENTTGDAVFDGALRLALATQIEQSPYLRVVSEQRIRGELGYMNRPPDTPITRAVALDVCQRVGAKAVVAGSLAPLGTHYAVGLEGVACESGEVIARHQAEAAGKEQVLGTLGQAISSIRERLGESVASIRGHDVPIAEATTASLDALKAFSQGDFERARGNDDDAVRFYRRATEIDPLFALAHVRLGLQLINLSRHGEGVGELEQAYAVRARASEGERFYITSMYYASVLRDPIKGIEQLESWRDAYPKSAVSRFSLASMYGRVGRLEEGLVQVREALRLEPNHALATIVLMETLARLGRVEEAKQLAEDEVARGRGSVMLRTLLASLAFERHDEAAVARELEWAETTAGSAPLFLEVRAHMARLGGKMREAARLTDRRIAAAEQHGDQWEAAVAGLDEALGWAIAGQPRESVPLVLAALRRGRSTPVTVLRAALASALAGDTDRAEQYLREYEKMPNVTPTSDPEVRPSVIALVEIGRGSPESALEALAPTRPYERGWHFNFLSTYVRGLAFERLRRPADAIAEYDRIAKLHGALPETLVYPFAWLKLGRLKAASGDVNGARAAYDEFLRWWKDADAALPVLAAAREERARLR